MAIIINHFSLYPCCVCVPTRDEATQVVCLQLVEAMLQSMGVADVAYILPHVTSFSAHSSTQCRQLMYNILMWLYNHT